MTIAFITRDYNGTFPNIIPAGCAFYRCLLPMSVAGQKARMGMPAWDPAKGFGIRETENTALFGFDTVLLKLIMDRWAPTQIDIAKSLGQRVIIDIDDYHEGLTPANKAYGTTHPEHNRRANREYYAQTIDKADTLVVSTPFLYDHYTQKHPDVRLVRNGVNMVMFPKRKTSGMKPVIGWAGAIEYRNNDLEQLREWLPAFLEEHDLRFHHAGHDPEAPSFAEIVGIPEWRVTTSPIVFIHEYPNSLQFDIGIVPLNDIPFNHAKSNIKGLEYAASGIPFVASALPEYRVLSESGVGLLAETSDQWVSQLTSLLDFKTRKRAAATNHAIVGREWAIEARAEEWQDVFIS